MTLVKIVAAQVNRRILVFVAASRARSSAGQNFRIRKVAIV
jgi:hypothetical protein